MPVVVASFFWYQSTIDNQITSPTPQEKGQEERASVPTLPPPKTRTITKPEAVDSSVGNEVPEEVVPAPKAATEEEGGAKDAVDEQASEKEMPISVRFIDGKAVEDFFVQYPNFEQEEDTLIEDVNSRLIINLVKAKIEKDFPTMNSDFSQLIIELNKTSKVIEVPKFVDKEEDSKAGAENTTTSPESSSDGE